MSVTEGSNRYYYILNQQGDVVGLINGNKKLVVEYYYDAWGRLIKTNGDLATTLGANNPLRYRGYVYDTETGLYYLQSRYYNPSWGRFINADDPGYMGVDGTPSSYNLFAYCGNNPVTRADEEGKFWLTTFLVGMAVRYVGDVIENRLAGEEGFAILKPRSTVGEYVAAGVTALIPGKGLGAAIVRNIFSEGITNFEDSVSGRDVNYLGSLGKIVFGSFLDVGFEKALGFVNKCIKAKVPGTYSAYAHNIRQSHPDFSMGQVKDRMRIESKLYHYLSEVVSFGSNAIRSCLFEI